MKKILWFFNHIEYILSTVFSGIMIFLLFIQVVSRYVFKHSLAYTEELAIILFILSVYFGAIGATRRDQHLKIELFTNTLSARGKLIAQVFANIAFIIANCFLTVGCIGITHNLYLRQMTTAITNIPKWIPYAVIPFALTIISIRLIQEIVLLIRRISSGEGKKDTV